MHSQVKMILPLALLPSVHLIPFTAWQDSKRQLVNEGGDEQRKRTEVTLPLSKNWLPTHYRLYQGEKMGKVVRVNILGRKLNF